MCVIFLIRAVTEKADLFKLKSVIKYGIKHYSINKQL